MKSNAIVIGGYYGFGNAGDELILRSLIDQFRNQDPQCLLTVLSADPEQTQRHFSVESVNRWHPWAWIGPLLRARRFILGGGGLLQESSGLWNHAYYLILFLLAKMLGCRTEGLSLGVDPIKYPFNRWWTRFVFDAAVDIITVRDADSQRALESTGIRRSILRSPDPVFQLSVPFSHAAEGRIALAVAPWEQRLGWDHDLAFLTDRLQDQLEVKTDFLVFFPKQDEELIRQIVQHATHPVGVRIWQQPEEVLAWAADYQLIIGMRYHALVLAALAGKAFIGWGFQKKIRSLCQEFGQPIWTLERGWEADSVFRQIADAWRHRDILPHRYSTKLLQYKSATPSAVEIARIHPPIKV